MKNKHAPNNAPDILVNIFDDRKFEISPIIITEPQVKKVVLCIPINRSVIAKAKIKAGMNFIPKIIGT